MLRRWKSAAFAACASLTFLPSAAVADPPSTEASSAPTLSAWSQRVFKDLDRELRVPIDDRTQVMPSGITAVKFGCSESGAPSSVKLYKSSGDGRLDRATVRAVTKIATLHPLPARLGHDQQYIIRVLFANSPSAAERQMKTMQEEAAKSNAWYNQNIASTAALELVPAA